MARVNINDISINASTLGGTSADSYLQLYPHWSIRDYNSKDLLTGFYRLNGTQDGQDKSMFPLQQDGQMLLNFQFMSGYLTQFLFSPVDYNNRMYYRYCGQSNWSDWKQIATS